MRKVNTYLLKMRGREFRSCRTPGVLPWSKAEKEVGLSHQQYQHCVKRVRLFLTQHLQPGNWTTYTKTRPELQPETITWCLIWLFIRQAHQSRKLLPKEQRTRLALTNRKHYKITRR